ncbi:MAG TPA: hypothetical protein ENH24_04035, partial [Nitrospirae bacterium]|nr:hypothetical protein [Nitrospirota bacterium]
MAGITLIIIIRFCRFDESDQLSPLRGQISPPKIIPRETGFQTEIHLTIWGYGQGVPAGITIKETIVAGKGFLLYKFYLF